MKTKHFSVLIVLLTIIGCNTQSQPTTNKPAPKTDIKVTKEYDDKGNLIRYDSVYSWYYSSIDSDSAMLDSIMRNFTLRFNQMIPFNQNPIFNDYFRREFSDTLFFEDFFKDDFFYQRFRRDIQTMDRWFREMDSIKNRFFLDYYQQQSKKNLY